MDYPLRDSEASQGSFDMQESLRELSWLSPEQQQVVEAKAQKQQEKERRRHSDTSALAANSGSGSGSGSGSRRDMNEAARRATQTMTEMAGFASRSAADAAELATRALTFDPHGGGGWGGSKDASGANSKSGSISGSIVSDGTGSL